MNIKTKIAGFEIKLAEPEDTPLILSFIKELAEYENLSHEVVADEPTLRESLFGERQVAEVIIGLSEGGPVSFTGTLTYTNPFFTSGVTQPLVILEDQAGFIDRDSTAGRRAFPFGDTRGPS